MTRNKRPERSAANQAATATAGLGLHKQVQAVADALAHQGLSIRLVSPWNRAPRRHQAPSTAELQDGLAYAIDLLECPPSDEERALMMADLPKAMPL